jgi:hypothetical protein
MRISVIRCPDCKREITILVPEENDPINGSNFDVVVYDEERERNK